MSDQTAARAPQSADGHGALRLLALAAVALGLLLLAAWTVASRAASGGPPGR